MRSPCITNAPSRALSKEGKRMKGIAAWFLGIPLVVIILFYLTGIF